MVGALAVLNAELLAGLVLAQLIREGAPVILGSLPASFDMHTMMSYYGAETMLLNLACGEMMAHYGVPHCGTSGSGGGSIRRRWVLAEPSGCVQRRGWAGAVRRREL